MKRKSNMHRTNRQLRPITVFLVVLAGTIPVGAQTTAQFPKATGVGNPVVQRAMTSLHPLATFRVGGNPDWMALTADSVWVTSSSTNSVIRLNTATDQVGESVTVAKPCSGLAIGFGSLWVPSCADHNLIRVDPETGKMSPEYPLAQPMPRVESRQEPEASGWSTPEDAGPHRPNQQQVVARIRIPPNSLRGRLCGWRGVDHIDGTQCTDPSRPATIKVVIDPKLGRSPRFLTVGAGSVWTLNQGDGTISRVDTKTGKLSAVADAGLSGTGGEIAFGEGSVWATLSGFPSPASTPRRTP